VLNGSKMLITFAPVADFSVVFATTNPSQKKWGLSLFIVERGMPGFEISPVEEKMGLRTVPIGRMTLTNCFVPLKTGLDPKELAPVSLTALRNLSASASWPARWGRWNTSWKPA
jgi:alkylation response protein AidB-like acyl-CoA dehydrogenase